VNKKKPLPPTYFWTSVVLMIGLHFLFPGIKLITPPFSYGGVVFLILGLWLNMWSSNYFKRVDTTIKPFEESSYLITEGLFRYSRHPMYLGMVLALVGLFILLGDLTPLLVIPVFVWVINKRFVLVEEKALEERFGEEYLKYRSMVRRWV
jgi:protein-S-isoprenylcysteine O-methyltransferase Ste14